jgi:Family of unknown function (DUF5989)
MNTPDQLPPGSANDFQRQAEEGSTNLFSELLGFLRENKKWWLIPIVVSLLLIGLLVFLGGTAVAPFIYTLW